MRKLAVVVIAVLALAGCSSKPQPAPTPTVTAVPTVVAMPPDTAACKDSIRSDLINGWSGPVPPSYKEPVCKGIDRSTLDRLKDEIVQEMLEG